MQFLCNFYAIFLYIFYTFLIHFLKCNFFKKHDKKIANGKQTKNRQKNKKPPKNRQKQNKKNQYKKIKPPKKNNIKR